MVRIGYEAPPDPDDLEADLRTQALRATEAATRAAAEQAKWAQGQVPKVDLREHATGRQASRKSNPRSEAEPQRKARTRPASPPVRVRSVLALLVATVLLAVIAAQVIQGSEHSHPFTPYAVPASTITTPAECGSDFTITHVELIDPSIEGSPATYQLTCSDGSTAWVSQTP